MSLKSAVLGANESVQKSGIFKTVKELFYEEGLQTSSRAGALEQMEKKASDNYTNSLKYYKNNDDYVNAQALTKTREQYAAQASVNAADTENTAAEAWKDMTTGDQDRLRGIAASRAAVKYGNPETNADLALSKYTKALNASRREVRARATGNAIKGYYVDPFKDGRYGTGAARAGVTAAGVGAAGAITYSLTGGGSPDYSANYSSSSGDGDTQDF